MTDLTDAEFTRLDPLLPPPKALGRPRLHPIREILNAIYVVRSGCAWRLLPHEFPPWQTAYHYFRLWRLDGTWEYLNAVLREQLRTTIGRNSQPSAAIINSQSVRTTGVGGVRGYDGAKRVNGRKRHVLVDTGGLVLRAKVHTANIQDRAAVPLLLEGADGQFPRVEHLWVDQSYTGTGKKWIEQNLGWRVEVVRHPPHPRGEWVPHGDLSRLETVWVQLAAAAARAKGVPRSAAQAVGGRADLRLALPKPALQPRLRAPVRNERGTHLCGDGPSYAPEVGSELILRQF